MDGAMSLGELIAAMMIVWRVLVPIQIVSLNIARLKQTLSTVRQINDLIRMGNERDSEVPPILSRRLNGQIFAVRCVSVPGPAARAATAGRQPRGQGWRDRRDHRTERQRQIDPAQGDPRPLSPVSWAPCASAGSTCGNSTPPRLVLPSALHRSNWHSFTAALPPTSGSPVPMRPMRTSSPRWRPSA